METQQTGIALARARRDAGLTQGEESALLGIQSSSSISDYERGRQGPSLVRAIVIAYVLGRTVEELFPMSADEVALIAARAEGLARECSGRGRRRSPERKAETLFRLASPKVRSA